MKKNTTVATRQDAHVKCSRCWFIFAGVNQRKMSCPASRRLHGQQLSILLIMAFKSKIYNVVVDLAWLHHRA